MTTQDPLAALLDALPPACMGDDICRIHNEVMFDGRCEDYDRDVRDAVYDFIRAQRAALTATPPAIDLERLARAIHVADDCEYDPSPHAMSVQDLHGPYAAAIIAAYEADTDA